MKPKVLKRVGIACGIGALLAVAQSAGSFADETSSDLGQNYTGLSANDKQDILFDKILNSKYSAKPDLNLGVFGVNPLQAGSIFIDELLGAGVLIHPPILSETLLTTSDELPASRRHWKVIHTYGTEARFEFHPAPGTPFTGIFKTGAIGILRFSYAGPPAIIGRVPGLGLKFLVDGHDSENLVVMNSLNDQGNSTSVFYRDFSNILPAPTGFIMNQIRKYFSTVNKPEKAFEQGLSHLAKIDRYGSSVDHPRFPQKLIFKPIDDQITIPMDTTNDFRDDLETLKPGTKIYDVKAVSVNGDTPAISIGTITVESLFVTSEFGDRSLFFKHSDENIQDRFVKKQLSQAGESDRIPGADESLVAD